jgi:hypothetical protein
MARLLVGRRADGRSYGMPAVRAAQLGQDVDAASRAGTESDAIWRNSPVRSVEEQRPRPARELSRTTNRGCERAGGGAGCHANSRRRRAFGLLKMGANRGVSSDGLRADPRRQGRFVCKCSRKRMRREAATASRWLLSTQVVRKKQVTFVVTESNWLIERSRAIELPRHPSLLSASPHYGGLPSLATANR